jgi:hypothetical protein
LECGVVVLWCCNKSKKKMVRAAISKKRKLLQMECSLLSSTSS